MKRFLVSLAGACLLLGSIGCNQSPTVAPEKTVTLNPVAGQFGISHLKGLNRAKDNSAVKEGENIRFDLGSIRGSTGFFFLLYNVGATPITEVTLNIANTGFTVFPTSMDTLAPGDELGMLPIVKVCAFHGTPMDGVGNRPLLPKGDNEFTLMITGHTKTSSGADTVIDLQAVMNLNALVMDFSISVASGTVDLQQGGAWIFQDYGLNLPELLQKTVNEYTMPCISDSLIRLTNTGNIPLTMRVYRCADSSQLMPKRRVEMQLMDTVLASGADVELPLVYNELNPSLVLFVSGDNTVCDPSRISLNDNGVGYLQIHSTSMNCIPGTSTDPKVRFFETHQIPESCASVHAYIDSTLIFFATKCSGTAEYGLYDLLTGEELCKRYGPEGDSANCSHEEYGDMLSMIVQSLKACTPNDKPNIVVPEPHQVGGGGTNNWGKWFE